MRVAHFLVCCIIVMSQIQMYMLINSWSHIGYLEKYIEENDLPVPAWPAPFGVE